MKCTICKKAIRGFGNNAEPVKIGECCDLCNDLYVIPARLKYLLGGYPEDDKQPMQVNGLDVDYPKLKQ